MGGCNCKSGKEQKLNNLNSIDHLSIAFDAYLDIKDKDFSQLDEYDSKLVLSAFFSVYPNAKGEVTPEHAAKVIKTVYEQNYGK
jgi:hypothetical protein